MMRGYLEKQSALGLTPETMFQPQSVFLANPSYREWLARKSCQEHIILRNTGLMNLRDVTCHEVIRIVVKVRLISFLGVGVPLAGKNAFATNGIQTNPDTTDSSKKVYKSEGGMFRFHRILRAIAVARLTFHSVPTLCCDLRNALLGVTEILRDNRKMCQARICHHDAAGRKLL